MFELSLNNKMKYCIILIVFEVGISLMFSSLQWKVINGNNKIIKIFGNCKLCNTLLGSSSYIWDETLKMNIWSLYNNDHLNPTKE